MTKIFSPNAVALVYNYLDRQGDYDLKTNKRDSIEKVWLVSDVIDIQTSKTKSQPAGSFSIRLAPTYNWVTKLTPGSWISIHMTPKDEDYLETVSYDSKHLKMIGRIDTVQIQVSVNQETGARETFYIVSGRDWGQVFDTTLYIDPASSVAGDAPLSQIMRYGFDKKLTEKDPPTLTSTTLLNFFIDIWGVQGGYPKFKEDFRSKSSGTALDADKWMPEAKFYLPKELVSAMNLKKGSKGGSSNTIANNLNIVPGRLKGPDDYFDDGEVGGFPDLGSVLGGNTLWQIFTAHSGTVVNELVTDFRWDSNRLALTLYKRVKPFLLGEAPSSKHGQKIASSFFNLKKIKIDKEQVLSVQAGTNWRDKINFLEVLPGINTSVPGYSNIQPVAKSAGSSVADPVSFGRDGFKPLMYTSKAVPFEGGQPSPKLVESMMEWLPVMKQWYFNTHKMLNGTVVISNQEEYIGVGDNIVLDGDLFSQSFHVKGDTSRGQKIKLLAHVESVSHNFTVDGSGARNFVTTVNFVRGVFTDSSCKKLLNDSKSYGIDSNATDLRQDYDEWANNVFRKEKGD